MKYRTTEYYDTINFVYVHDHYDYHLSGLCRYNRELSYFTTIVPDEVNPNAVVKIYRLSSLEKIRQLYSKWLFEKMVGYHWTYPNRRNGELFEIRNPKWFYSMLFKLYYMLPKELR